MSSPYRLTVQDAADYLQLPKKTIYNLAERGELDHLRTCGRVTTRVLRGQVQPVRVSGRLRFSQAGLDAWVAAHRVPAAPAAPVPAPVRVSPLEPLPMPRVRRFS